MGEQGGYFLSLLSASAVLRVQVYGHVWSRRYLACVHDLDQSGESKGDVLLLHSCEVKCSKCHLSAWFADGLGGDYSCSLAGFHQSALVVLDRLQDSLVNSDLRQLRVYSALAQLVEYQRR